MKNTIMWGGIPQTPRKPEYKKYLCIHVPSSHFELDPLSGLFSLKKFTCQKCLKELKVKWILA